MSKVLKQSSCVLIARVVSKITCIAQNSRVYACHFIAYGYRFDSRELKYKNHRMVFDAIIEEYLINFEQKHNHKRQK